MILLLGFGLRIYGLNWDQGHHLHPDERFLTMVADKIQWPASIKEYFDTQNSPLNPRNQDYGFFIYGTLPLFITKLMADVLNLNNYENLVLVGRFLSASADLGIIFLLYKISKKLWPSLFYSLMVLPIQLSHFFAVDTFLNLFLVLSFYSALNWPIIFTGLFLGLALSCKITAILFLPIIFLVFLKRYKKLKKIILVAIGMLLTATLTARVFNPYMFTSFFKINPEFIADIKELKSWESFDTWFPPAIQWIKTKPLIFPIKNMILWGLGIPMGLLVILSLGYVILNLFQDLLNRKGLTIKLLNYLTISLFWIFFLLTFQGTQFVKTMRYFLPIYPFIALITGSFIARIKNKYSKLLILGSMFLYPVMFMNIYVNKHTRVQASEWIYNNIPAGSTLSCEHWDDCLPLPVGNKNSRLYNTEILTLYDRDSEQKWQKINQQLENIDYIIISSSRLYDSIPTVPEKYPVTSKFYQDLFAEKLNFAKLKEFTSYPSFFCLEINDDISEEAFTVYDHPKVLIFKKVL